MKMNVQKTRNGKQNQKHTNIAEFTAVRLIADTRAAILTLVRGQRARRTARTQHHIVDGIGRACRIDLHSRGSSNPIVGGQTVRVDLSVSSGHEIGRANKSKPVKK
jgi:hypothetical protein